MTQGMPFHLLVVEDDRNDRLLLDEAFIELQYQTEVLKFLSGRALFDYLIKVDPELYPSLIVIDGYLSGERAEDIVAVLKSNPQTSSIPVVIYSSAMAPASRERLLTAGADACMEKPLLHHQLLDVCRQMVRIAERNTQKDSSATT